MTRVNLNGISKVHKRMADGTVRKHHYAGRGKGAVKFWDTGGGIALGSAEYIAAFAAAKKGGRAAHGKFRALIVSFIESQDFSKLAPRTQADVRRSINHAANGMMLSSEMRHWVPSKIPEPVLKLSSEEIKLAAR